MTDAFATRAVHAGTPPDPITGAIAPTISPSVNHVYDPESGGFSANDVSDMTAKPFVYARWTNPTVRMLEQRVADLEEGETALASASGMAALATLFLGNLRAGDHLIVSDVCYPGVRELASQLLPGLGIEVSAVNLSQPEALRDALRPETRLVHAETPCNPILRLTDLHVVAEITHEAGALLSVDSTLATPVATRPLAHGADVVMHSATKYLNGHGDAMGGVLIGAADIIEPLRATWGVRLGATLDPRAAALILRGIDTLVPRVETASRNTLSVAEILEASGVVERVIYPGLASHPQYDLAMRQMDLGGAVLSFRTRDVIEDARRLYRNLRLVRYAVSLGHQHANLCLLKTDDLMSSTYHLPQTEEEEYRIWAGNGVLRLSVGLEDPDDIAQDILSALEP
ncbi:PLP-dependent aspartate aminotransferase family protein [Kiloniella sp. EL199]|uniref:trans-sulfuration enzyme family protein n=1 Tax=Kiloniella sp. EL199 TaxID=2107581 RepID=UPI000EA2F3E9|nr:PLP-dependent transferase [Kiloniella sp. EL199]